MSQQVGTILDIEDLVPGHYTLEVSSQGSRPSCLSPRTTNGFRKEGADHAARRRGGRKTGSALAGYADGAVMMEIEPGSDTPVPFEPIQKSQPEVRVVESHPEH